MNGTSRPPGGLLASGVLFLLAPFVGEVLGASLRLSYFVEPLRVSGILLFYGAGVVLIREVARRLGLNWWGIALLGLAFALIEEGLALQTIFNPVGMGGEAVFGRALGTNWFWVVVVCGYHLVWSVLIPIAVAEWLFPHRRRSAWLPVRGSVVLAVLFGIGTAVFTLISYLRSDYRLAPLPVAITLLLVLGSVWAATRCVDTPKDVPSDVTGAQSSPPHPAAVAWAGLAGGIAWFVLHIVVFTGSRMSFVVWTGIALALAAAAALLLARWTRSGWTPHHQLALCFGTMLSVGLFGLLIVTSDDRPENLAFQLVLLFALPIAYIYLKRTRRPEPSRLEAHDPEAV